MSGMNQAAPSAASHRPSARWSARHAKLLTLLTQLVYKLISIVSRRESLAWHVHHGRLIACTLSSTASG